MTDPVPDRGALSLGTRTGLPEALRVLSEDFPREGWEKHPGLDGMVKFWLDRHIAFRRLTALMRDDTMALIGGDMEHGTFAPRLTRMGNHFLSDLHAHHSIEDAYFFPRLVDLDSRISHGFGLLEADHEEIDGALHKFAGAARVVLDGGEGGPFAEQLALVDRFLDRHLTDEEDLIVPVLLKTGYQL